MKKCPKCHIGYSEAWNICPLCESNLVRVGVLKSFFIKPRPSSVYPFSLIEKAIDKADIVFLYLNKDLKPMMCNQAIEYITGYSREEIFKRDWLELLYRNNPSRRELFKAVITSCLMSSEARAYVGVITKKDSSQRILSWRNMALTNDAGNITGIVCTAYDITETKSSEDGSAVQYERLRNIFASIKDYALITTNLEGKITYYGEGGAKLFGWKEDMTLKDIGILFPTADRYPMRDRIEAAIKRYGRFEEELTLLKSEKEEFPAMFTVTNLLDTKNKTTGYVYIARDITEAKRIEKQMIESEKLAAIGQLASGVAHEMNNPLLVIKGRLEMLYMDEERFTPEVKSVLDIIKAQADRMKVIVDRLLTYSRKSAPRMDIMDVNEILKAIAPLLTYHPEFKKIAWKEELTADIPKIRGDSNQLQELFLNITLNACQAMPEGGTITIGSRDRKDGFMEVSIMDTGVGIKKEDLEKIFSPFFTTKDKGTGLGLAICQNIVSSHGGKIDVESEIGKGSTFTVRFPVSKE